MKTIDLSFPIHEGMTTFPSHWHPFVEVTQLGRHGIEDRESRKVTLGTHTGTHVDAPLHFVAGGAPIDSMPPALMTGKAGLIDLSPAKPKHEHSLSELKKALGKRKILPRMLVRFGWSKRWGKIEYYTKAPHLSLEACRWLVSQGVRLLGVDTPNVDDHEHGWKSGNDCPNHHALLGRGVYLVEYMNNLDRLRGPEVELIVCPLNILGADGAPARCLAVERS
ncbi:MAG: cyclase family protein [Elusimicrobia bacterium]|nr:cyclase family protein [Elusimicrobiota bacterium]